MAIGLDQNVGCNMIIARRRLKYLFALALVYLVCSTVAWATIRKVPGAWLWGPKAVWTDGSANPMFHPFSDAIDTGDRKSVV